MISEDQSLVLNTPEGLVAITGCGHAGIVNILTFAREQFPKDRCRLSSADFIFFQPAIGRSIGQQTS
jgi:hypothetical protein